MHVQNGSTMQPNTTCACLCSTAEAAAKVLQAMNPLVNITAVPSSPRSCTDASFLQQYDLVVATGQSLGAMQALDLACSAASVAFMAAAVQGYSSYFFLNLQRHTYLPKVGIEWD